MEIKQGKFQVGNIIAKISGEPVNINLTCNCGEKMYRISHGTYPRLFDCDSCGSEFQIEYEKDNDITIIYKLNSFGILGH